MVLSESSQLQIIYKTGLGVDPTLIGILPRPVSEGGLSYYWEL